MSDAANLPPLRLPSGVSEEQQQFNRSVLQWIQMREGQQGNSQERVLLQRDLAGLGIGAGGIGNSGALPANALAQLATRSRAEEFAAFAAKIIGTRVFQNLMAGANDSSRFSQLDQRLRDLLETSIAEKAAQIGTAISRIDETIQNEREQRATVIQELTTKAGSQVAGLRMAQSVTVANGKATAAQVTQLQSRLDDADGHGATVEEVLLTVADQITGLLAQKTIKVTAGGAMAGIGIAAESPLVGPSDSYIIMAAKRFAFVQETDVLGTGAGQIDPNNPGATRIPFGIDADGTIYLNGQVRINAGGSSLANVMQSANGAYTWTTRGGMTIKSGSNVAKTSGAVVWGNDDAYSNESFTGGAYVSYSPAVTLKRFMIGLNRDPVTDANYTSLDHAWYTEVDGNGYIYESGSSVVNGGAYTTSTVFSITYDGSDVRYYKDGALVRTLTIGAGVKFFLDSAWLDVGSEAKNIAFGPVGARGAAGANGTNGANGANGANGLRGSVQSYYQRPAPGWSDVDANNRTFQVSGTNYLVGGDTATQSYSNTWAETRYWTGGAWVPPGVVIDGNLLVRGSITATNGAIGSLAVTTLNIQDNAVTVPSGSVLASDTGTFSAMTTILAGINIDTGGQPLAVMMSLAFTMSSGGAQKPIAFYVKINGITRATLLTTAPFMSGSMSRQVYIASPGTGNLAITIVADPTYDGINGEGAGTGGSTCNCFYEAFGGCSVVAIGMKK